MPAYPQELRSRPPNSQKHRNSKTNRTRREGGSCENESTAYESIDQLSFGIRMLSSRSCGLAADELLALLPPLLPVVAE